MKYGKILFFSICLFLFLLPLLSAHVGHGYPYTKIDVNIKENIINLRISPPMICIGTLCESHYDYGYNLEDFKKGILIKNNEKICALKPEKYSYEKNHSAGKIYYYLEYKCDSPPSYLDIANTLFYEEAKVYLEQYYIFNCSNNPTWVYTDSPTTNLVVEIDNICDKSFLEEKKSIPEKESKSSIIEKLFSFFKFWK